MHGPPLKWTGSSGDQTSTALSPTVRNTGFARSVTLLSHPRWYPSDPFRSWPPFQSAARGRVLLVLQRRQYQPGALAKADPEAVALAVTPQRHRVAVLQESSAVTAGQLDPPGAVPRKLQHAPEAVGFLRSQPEVLCDTALRLLQGEYAACACCQVLSGGSVLSAS